MESMFNNLFRGDCWLAAIDEEKLVPWRMKNKSIRKRATKVNQMLQQMQEKKGF